MILAATLKGLPGFPAFCRLLFLFNTFYANETLPGLYRVVFRTMF